MDADVIGTTSAVRALFRAAVDPTSPLSMTVHRIGTSLLLEGDPDATLTVAEPQLEHVLGPMPEPTRPAPSALGGPEPEAPCDATPGIASARFGGANGAAADSDGPRSTTPQTDDGVLALLDVAILPEPLPSLPPGSATLPLAEAAEPDAQRASGAVQRNALSLPGTAARPADPARPALAASRASVGPPASSAATEVPAHLDRRFVLVEGGMTVMTSPEYVAGEEYVARAAARRRERLGADRAGVNESARQATQALMTSASRPARRPSPPNPPKTPETPGMAGGTPGRAPRRDPGQRAAVQRRPASRGGALPGDAGSGTGQRRMGFRRVALWSFQGLRLVLGSDLLVLRDSVRPAAVEASRVEAEGSSRSRGRGSAGRAAPPHPDAAAHAVDGGGRISVALRAGSAGRATALSRAEALDLYIENAAANVPELLLCHVESAPFADGVAAGSGSGAERAAPAPAPRPGAASGAGPTTPEGAAAAPAGSAGTALRVTRVERIATEDITAASSRPFSPYAAEHSAAELLRFLRVSPADLPLDWVSNPRWSRGCGCANCRRCSLPRLPHDDARVRRPIVPRTAAATGLSGSLASR